MNERVNSFIIEYLEREYALPTDCNLETFNFVKTGYVDSLGIVQFISSIEEEFNIEFTDEELEDPSIQIVGNMIRLILSKLGQ